MGQINILADGLRIDSTKIQLTEQDRFCDHVLSADGGMYLRAVRAAFAPHPDIPIDYVRSVQCRLRLLFAYSLPLQVRLI